MRHLFESGRLLDHLRYPLKREKITANGRKRTAYEGVKTPY